jgi:hypothetical protein
MALKRGGLALTCIDSYMMMGELLSFFYNKYNSFLVGFEKYQFYKGSKEQKGKYNNNSTNISDSDNSNNFESAAEIKECTFSKNYSGEDLSNMTTSQKNHYLSLSMQRETSSIPKAPVFIYT